MINYFVLELIEKVVDFSEVIDVWFLGCVFFDLIIVFFLTEEEVVVRLGEVREDFYKLEEVFEDVVKV